ncbi:unnamed protein product [Parascedosporium putredinis]|uniref:U3 small nucleolar ribonucleoprotein protein IMP4 n=1 Tax=Parascedosporium putredinis TaxID=1442378 RepID=A0A9P1H3J7_9PEZI|nr:unnamed protein product [Parascedosporium putredinis]CAI7995889.1 unnamed protein product [Parascedosporium putredinis]
MIRKQARQRRDYLYRRAVILKEAEISEKRAKLRSAIAAGRSIDSSVAQDKDLRKDFQYDESRQDLDANEMADLDDEYHLSGIQDPRILVTTSRDPSSRLATFSKEIRLLFPTSVRLNRGNLILPDLPFPHGPTASFSLHNVVLRGDIPGSLRGTVSEQFPRLIFDGFETRLGQRVTKILKIYFPRDPLSDKSKIGSRVITFKNIEDSVEVRHHVFVKTSYDRVELAEVGPRMTMRLFEIRSGTLENKDGDVEWHLSQYTRTAKKKNYL